MARYDDLWDSWTRIPDYDNDEAPYGWGVYPGQKCLMCNHEWTVVAPVGSRGLTCPRCGHFDESVKWGKANADD